MTDRKLIAVMPMSELAPNKLHACTVAGLELLVCQLSDAVHVLENRCTHGASRLEGGLFRNGEVTCPLHGARFSLRTGKALTPPARRPLRLFEVVQQDDTLLIVEPPPEPERPKFGPLG